MEVKAVAQEKELRLLLESPYRDGVWKAVATHPGCACKSKTNKCPHARRPGHCLSSESRYRGISLPAKLERLENVIGWIHQFHFAAAPGSLNEQSTKNINVYKANLRWITRKKPHRNVKLLTSHF